MEVDTTELKTYREGNKVIILMLSEDDARKLCKLMHSLKDAVDCFAMFQSDL